MSGIRCLQEGFSLVREPGLRNYVLIPMLINAVVLAVLVGLSVGYFNEWVDKVAAQLLPDWLSFLYWLIWATALLLVIFILFYLFTIIANLVASPFNALLAEKVEEKLTGRAPPAVPFMTMVLRGIGRELSKLMYLLPRLIGLVLLSLIPLVNVIAAPLWLLFSGWMMAVQYCDVGADNNGVSFAELRRALGRRRFQATLFGLPVYLLLAIPLVNLVLMPVAVAGGTVFWVRHLQPQLAQSSGS